MPRTGGIAIVSAILIGALLLDFIVPFARGLFWMLGGVLLLAITAILDDLYQLNKFLRFLVQVMAALLVVYAGLLPAKLVTYQQYEPWVYYAGIIIIIAAIVWMINLYNFMDGMDGFAGGMAVFGFGTLAIIGMIQGRFDFFWLNIVCVASVIGFLIYNFPPAKIFMGDVGSVVLGYLAACFALWADRENIVPVWISVLVFSPFIADSTITLLKRIRQRKKIWEAHKTHYYQRVVELGFGHKQTVLYEYVLMFFCALTAVLILKVNGYLQLIGILVWCVVYFALHYFVIYLERKSCP